MDGTSPRLWVLTGPKAGDNAQVLRAAEASGLPFEVRRVAIRAGRLTAKPEIAPSLDELDIASSDRLEAPWPDVVVTIGRHLSRVALWIKAQSGGQTRIALLNAPKGRWADFGLVVLPPWYRNPGTPNVLPIRMPLIGMSPVRLAAAHAQFASVLAPLPRPLHVLLVGGDMGLQRLEPRFAAGIVSRMTQGFAATGSIFAATSRRTPAAVADALAGALRPQDRLYRFGTVGVENPYLGLLAHGDSFTVTGDSLSMVIEAARLGKPLAIAELPQPSGLSALARRITDLLRPRNLGQALDLLYRGGHAVPLGAAMKLPPTPLPDDAEHVGARLRQLAGVKS